MFLLKTFELSLDKTTSCLRLLFLLLVSVFKVNKFIDVCRFWRMRFLKWRLGDFLLYELSHLVYSHFRKMSKVWVLQQNRLKRANCSKSWLRTSVHEATNSNFIVWFEFWSSKFDETSQKIRTKSFDYRCVRAKVSPETCLWTIL